ncbi:probable lipase Mil1p [[Candida] railenensis]|uniref:Probable lipase Mil1p n=1 Tax=[Candida] railenensis TaxID=45579 RepID=A0A9P0QRK3_9ASCO|nr:probable lipase Mil1p [[Candida] railenensis]
MDRTNRHSLNYDEQPPFQHSTHSRTHPGVRFGSRAGASTLPSLPTAGTGSSFDSETHSVSVPSTPLGHEFRLASREGSPQIDSQNANDADADEPEESYFEFDLGGGADHEITTSPARAIGSEKYISTSSLNLDQQGPWESRNSRSRSGSDLHSQISAKTRTVQDQDTERSTVAEEPESPQIKLRDVDDDFFSSGSNWKAMKTIAELDFYDDRGELEYTSNGLFDENGLIRQQGGSRGYTKIDTEEQVAKYAELDKKTDFLFQRTSNQTQVSAAYGKEDLDQEHHKSNIGDDERIDEDDETKYDSSDSEYEDDDNLQSKEQLETTKSMLSDAQKFAYIGIAKLIAVEMATELAMLKSSTSSRVAKNLMAGQKNFGNWMSYVTLKLFEHLELSKEEQRMIENLSVHGLEVNDLTSSLIGAKVDITERQSRRKNKKGVEQTTSADLVWILICDLFLVLLSEGYYDSRSRTLVIQFANYLQVSNLEVFQFERRLIDSLELDESTATDKSFENKEELLNDRTFIDKHIKKNKKRRYAYIGLATLGGGLAIGLSAGLLAPVIGAGLAAGLTTVGITGTGGFLAGVGGSAIITTGGALAGVRVGSKASARRLGDVHTFELKPLHNNKRTNLILTVSGWMNGELDDVRLPFSTVDPVMGDMFSLLWEPEMLQSMGQTINILASEALTTSIQQILGATVLTALMAAIQLPMALSKLSYILDNPWNVSLDRAWKAGKILADTLIAGNCGVRPITLVGFSLGARLIYSCLIELAKRGGYGLVENVIMLGSPITVKVDQMATARSVVSGKFINGYSRKDWILGYLFRATGGGIQTVAGLQEITNVQGIENVDCTDLVEGHMSYRKAIPKILKKLDWEVLDEEFAEIEEPDPEQGEKTRKLIHEFDEARAKMLEEQQNGTAQKEKKNWKNWFKKGKKKEWWEVYGESEEAKAKNSEEQQNRDEGHNPGGDGEYEEYNVEEDRSAMPIFDLDALQQEVNDIAQLADKGEASLENVRKEVDEIGPAQHVTNEDLEEDQSEAVEGSIMNKISGLGSALTEKVKLGSTTEEKKKDDL